MVFYTRQKLMAKDLTTSVVYKRRQQKIKTEEFLLLSDMATLKTWFEN